MLYAIVGQDVPDSLNLRLPPAPRTSIACMPCNRPGACCWPAPSRHRQQRSRQRGFSGSLIVAEFDTLADAQAGPMPIPTCRRRVCQRQRQTVQESVARMSTADLIRQRLAALEPETFTLEDESAQHKGHAGAASGGGHFRLTVVSPRFRNLSTLARHRLVYETMGELMQREIHALSITALTPEEL
jgi:BolA family transcriptional regulator, general stress-responsive regulator